MWEIDRQCDSLQFNRHGCFGNQNLISGNVVYGNTLAALDQNAGAESTIVNNTFYQPMAME